MLDTGDCLELTLEV